MLFQQRIAASHHQDPASYSWPNSYHHYQPPPAPYPYSPPTVSTTVADTRVGPYPYSPPTTVVDTPRIPQQPQTANPTADGPTKSRDKSKKSNGNRHSGDRYSKNKRNRTIFNAAQLDALARIFTDHPYPDIVLRKKIAGRLDIDEERIQVSIILFSTTP